MSSIDSSLIQRDYELLEEAQLPFSSQEQTFPQLCEEGIRIYSAVWGSGIL